MTPWHIAVLILVGFAALWLGVVVGACITASRADEAIKDMQPNWQSKWEAVVKAEENGEGMFI